MIRQMAHINFFTNDVDRMIDFYVNNLGLKIKFTMKNDEGVDFGWYFDCGHSTFIEIFDQAGAVKQWGGEIRQLVPGTQYKHFCFEVTGLDQYCANLQKRGVQVTPISTGMDNSRQAWVEDPDGNAIELMEYGPFSLQL